MKFTQEKIVDLILHGPTSSHNSCDEFEELLENYMETFASDMSEEDADLAYGFSDWISDIYYECWSPHHHRNMVEVFESTKSDNFIEYPSLTNITTKRLKQNFSEEEDINILKFLIQHRNFSRTNDIKLWTLMENHNVILRRSAQSMKERFNKKISPNLTLKLFCAIYVELL